MAKNQGGSNVVLNFKTNGQVQYAQTIREINMVLQTATREYQAQVAAMGRSADMTEKMRAEERKLQTQLQASSEKVRMLSEDYANMQNDTTASAASLQRLYNQLLQAQTAHGKLEQSMEGVREGLNAEAIAARQAEEEYKKLKNEASTLDAEQRRLASSFELQRVQLGATATETERAALAQQQFTAQMELADRAISNVEQQLNAAKQAYGDNSTEVIRLETALNNAQTTQQRLTDEFNNATQSTQQNVTAMDRLRTEASELSTEQQRLRSEYQLLEAQLGANVDESVRYIYRQQQLRDEMRLSERNVSNLEAQLEEARRTFGDSSQEVMRLQTRLNNARIEIQKFSNELDEMQQAANHADSAMDGLSAGMQALAGAIPAAAIAGIVGSTQEAAIQMGLLETQVTNATKTVQTFSQKSKKMTEDEVKAFEGKLNKQENQLAKSLDNQVSAVEKSHEQQMKSLEKSLDKEYDLVSNKYEAQEESRQKSLDAQYDAAVDIYDKQLAELEKALEDEVEAFEKASEEKLALIDKEYTERLKLIDEDKYRQIKAIEDEINSINAVTEAEDKAREERENAKKRAELQDKIRTSKDSKSRQEASQALKDFEERLRVEKVKEERKAQIDNLKSEKDAVNETFTVKKDALKEEFDERKKQTKDSIDAEKEVIKERQEIEKESFVKSNEARLDLLKENREKELEALRSLNESKLESLREEQNYRKEILSERLEGEMNAIRESHQAELDSFKEMNKQKVDLAANPIDIPEQEQKVKVSADLDMDDIKQARVYFASVNQDVGQVTEAMGNLIQAGYTTEEQITDISESLSGAITKYGETFTAEGLAESINTTSQLGEVTGQLTDLLEKEGVNVEDFNEKLLTMGDSTERANYISELLASQGLNDMYQEYAKLNPEVVAAAEAQLEHEDAMVELGNVLRPLVTEVTNFVTKIIEWANENPKLTQGLAIAAAAIGALVAAAAVLSPIITAITSIMAVAGVSIGAIASPVLIVIGVIAGLVAAIIAVIAIVKNWGDISDWLSEKWGQLGDFFSSFWSKITDLFWGAIEGITKFLKEWGPTLLVVLTGPIGLLVKKVIENWGTIKKKTSEIFNSVRDSMKKAFQTIYNNTIGKIGDMKNKATDIFGRLKDAIVKPIEKARDAIGRAIEAIKGFFNFEFKWPELKMPKFEVSKGSLNPLKWFDEGFPEIDVKWHAKGGIMTRPTIFGASGNELLGGGEAGAEAILPLNEKNLGEIGRAIASTMEGVDGREVVIPLTVELEGEVIARKTVKYTDRELFGRIRDKDRGGRKK